MSKQEDKKERRDFLFTATYTVGAVGLGAEEGGASGST